VPALPAVVPTDMLDLFEEPALGHVAYRATDGRLAIWPMWVSWDGAHLLTSSPVDSRKGQALRVPGAEVAVSILSTRSPWRWISITGRVVDVRPDEGLAFIDSQARRYIGSDYPDRGQVREVFAILPDRVTTPRARG